MLRQEGLGGVKGSDGVEMLSQAWTMADKRCGELRRVLDEAGR